MDSRRLGSVKCVEERGHFDCRFPWLYGLCEPGRDLAGPKGRRGGYGLDMAKSWTGRGQEWPDMVMSSRVHGQVE